MSGRNGGRDLSVGAPGTFVDHLRPDGVIFFIGALLLMPERTEEPPNQAAAPA